MAQDRWTLQEEKESQQPLQATGHVAGCSHAVQGLPLLNERSEPQTVHGLPVQSRVAAAIRAAPAIYARILAHMVMNRGGGCKTEQGQQAWGQGKGRQARHGKIRLL